MLRELVSATVIIVVSAIAAPASAASHLECVDTGYSAQGQAAIEKFLTDFDVANFEKQSAGGAVIPVFGARAGECAGQHGWSMDAISDSVFYRMAALLEQGLRRHSPYTVEQMQRLDAALARADKDRLNRMFGPMMDMEQRSGPHAQPNPEDRMYLGMLLLSSGVPLDEKSGKFAGTLIGALVMKDIYARKFAGR